MHSLISTLSASNARRRRMQAVAGLFLAVLPPAASATTCYVSSSSGSDSNNGTSTMTPYRTLAKANSVMASPKAGDAILFKRGDAWRNQTLRCVNDHVTVTNDTTASVPQLCSGSSAGQVTIGAYGTGSNRIFDGATPFNVALARVSGTTYSATFSGAAPLKLYADAGDANSNQLIPVPNARGAWNSSTTYNAYDGVTDSNGNYFVRGPSLRGASRPQIVPPGLV